MEAFSFFNIGFGEVAFILVLAGVLLGPQRIRGVARYLGYWVGRSQQVMHSLRTQLNSELDAAERAELRGALADIQQLRRQVDELRREINPTAVLSQNGHSLYRSSIDHGPHRSPNSHNANGATPSIGRPPAETADLPKVVYVEDDPA